MVFAAGTKLGPYEIVSPLGAGGMGEVYRATDTRLNRAVAVKVLSTALSSNPDARQRFEREARTISSLNHPNICTLYDVGHQSGTDYLVMELLEGESLADRLAKGALPTEQLLKYGIDICNGLDKAHKSGIIHRDLKPGNIMLTKSGAKLLDFGLAKPQAVLGVATSNSGGITVTSPASPVTQQGSMVGTFQYMSPEQVEGRDADARSDIFALGAVLYEMATGKRAFQGKSMISVASAILEKEPEPISAIQPMTPPALEHVIKTCLAKDPDERFQTAHDVKLQLRWVEEGGSQAGVAKPVAARRKKREWLAWALAGALSLIMLATGWILHRPSPSPVVRSMVVLPPKVQLDSVNRSIALSPDGKRLALAANGPEGKEQLYLRSIDALTFQPVPGTEGATYPFWSPDGEYIGFFSGGKLKKIQVSSGAIQTIADAQDGRGATWNKQGVIVFAPAGDTGLFSVPDSGGTPESITQPEGSGISHRLPSFLPDGRHALYFVGNSGKSGTWVLDLQTKRTDFVVTTASSAVYVDPGYLLYVKEGTLLAQPFSLRTLKVTGRAVPVSQRVQYGGLRWVSNFEAGANGLLFYQQGQGTGEWQLTWLDLNGKELGKVGEPRLLSTLLLSRDAKRAITLVADPNASKSSVWMYDVDRGSATRFTYEDGLTQSVAWSNDGKTIAYSVNSQGVSKVYLKPADGTRSPVAIYQQRGAMNFGTFSPDDKTLSFDTFNPKTNKSEIWMLTLNGSSASAHVFLHSDQQNFHTGEFSRDGRWLTFDSDETGRDEAYVVPFPGPGEKRQVSTSGMNGYVGWYGKRGVADEAILYLDSNAKVISIPVTEKGDGLELGQPKVMFGDRTFFNASGAAFSPDWKRCLVALSSSEQDNGSLVMISNWTASLEK